MKLRGALFFSLSLLAKLRIITRRCSKFNCKPQAESHQQHLALYMDRHLRSVVTMKEATSRHMQCTHFNFNYSQIPAVPQQ